MDRRSAILASAQWHGARPAGGEDQGGEPAAEQRRDPVLSRR
ncbi:MAG: hypothetical protein AVDCRST_MAG27-474 [uncultured Craurococcus sp.]|uniref:Uncharacterized protein n=1 Tax=uncultured Craurococcus sp. TaxID=1135998 RepID=A0A6J4HFR3_9PROT|nr:MAG: hypothetical protein AVDCRST_MAG27-474 [uncultured Craurococcus sp.]